MMNSLSTCMYVCLKGGKKKGKAVGITEKPTTTTKPVCVGFVLQLLLLRGVCGSQRLAQKLSCCGVHTHALM